MMLGLLTVLSCLAVVTRALEGDECRFGSGVGVCVGFTTCGPVLKHIQARISICNYTPREAVVCCPVDYRSRLQKIRQQADALSVSMRKCKEYQRPPTVYLSSLKPNAEVVQKQAKQCSNDNKLIIGGEAAKWAEFPHMAWATSQLLYPERVPTDPRIFTEKIGKPRVDETVIVYGTIYGPMHEFTI